jgi:hypothetical protein
MLLGTKPNQSLLQLTTLITGTNKCKKKKKSKTKIENTTLAALHQKGEERHSAYMSLDQGGDHIC